MTASTVVVAEVLIDEIQEFAAPAPRALFVLAGQANAFGDSRMQDCRKPERKRLRFHRTTLLPIPRVERVLVSTIRQDVAAHGIERQSAQESDN